MLKIRLTNPTECKKTQNIKNKINKLNQNLKIQNNMQIDAKDLRC